MPTMLQQDDLWARILQLLSDEAEWSTAKISRGLERKAAEGLAIVTTIQVQRLADEWKAALKKTLDDLLATGLVSSPRPGFFKITAAGRKAAKAGHPGIVLPTLPPMTKPLPSLFPTVSLRHQPSDTGRMGKKDLPRPPYPPVKPPGFPGLGKGKGGGLGSLGTSGKGLGAGSGAGGLGSGFGQKQKLTRPKVDPQLIERLRQQIAHKHEQGESQRRPLSQPHAHKLSAPVPPATPPEPPDDPRLVSVWFGTHRRPVDPANASRGFTNEESDYPYYGQCRVSVPRSHKLAGKKSFWQVVTLGIGTEKFEVVGVDRMEAGAFWSGLGAALERKMPDRENAVLLFIHGYKNSFEAAAKRTAQLKVDLKIPHAVFYSWPSRDEVRKYPEDEAIARATKPRLAAFLTELGRLANARAVPLHIVAHSMGNLALLEAMQTIHADLQGRALPFRLAQVIFAAPDVDKGEFAHLVKYFAGACIRRTLYATDKDFPIEASSKFRNRSRAGKLPPATLADGVDTVDVADADLHGLAHGYVADSQRVILDMVALMQHNAPPATRGGVAWADEPKKSYYRFT